MLVTCSKFHQHFTSSFLPISLWQKNYNVKLWEEKKLRKALEYKKGEREMLMKLMPESGNRKREVSRTINLPKSLRNRIPCLNALSINIIVKYWGWSDIFIRISNKVHWYSRYVPIIFGSTNQTSWIVTNCAIERTSKRHLVK